MSKRRDSEDRRQQQLRRIGTNTPLCLGCGESDPLTFEKHHIAGRRHHEDLATICANCHRKLSHRQLDHAISAASTPKVQRQDIGHYLHGLADLLEMVAATLRRFASSLLGNERKSK
jgi:hypothetical protein